MKLSVIIVNYNVRYFLEQALLSVRRAAEGLAVETWVVDNNSVDDSVAMVREKFPEVHLITNAHNPGFSVANNQAIHRSAGEYVLLLNPDTVVEETTFRRCIAFMDAHPQAGGLGVRMIDGAGKFLPESKRGFPTPWVAFCKTIGLARLFPHSRRFNRYHLGYLPEHDTNRVEVLAGAFMWLRRTVLNEVGLLDEAFFMYGEDIDLSYRIVQAGYHNYYFPATTILHYKGESTKKGSLNYVRAFYQAMIIFARKHFRGRQARLFVWMLQVAIYLRAAVALLHRWGQRLLLPLLDASLLYAGLVLIKNFWEHYYFREPGYLPQSLLLVYFPIYCLVWLGGIFFSGGYDEGFNLRRLLRGLLLGSLVLAASYGLLPESLRPSRAILIIGAVWAPLATISVRMVLHLLRFGNTRIGRDRPRRLLVVGSPTETDRVLQLLQRVGVTTSYLGRIATPDEATTDTDAIGRLDQLAEAAQIYRADEVIFCSRDLPTEAIMRWMTALGPHIHYKILPEASLSIIGSHSRDQAGELYTIDVRFAIAQPWQRRNKRLLDIGLALLLLVTWPLQWLLVRRPLGLLANAGRVLVGRWSWVGYRNGGTGNPVNLPPLRRAVFSPADNYPHRSLTADIYQQLDLLYARDYDPWLDLEIILKNWRRLGQPLP